MVVAAGCSRSLAAPPRDRVGAAATVVAVDRRVVLGCSLSSLACARGATVVAEAAGVAVVALALRSVVVAVRLSSGLSKSAGAACD